MSLLTHFEDVPELDPTHRWLVEALLFESPRNAESFQRWVESVDFDKLDRGSLRLVPALYDRFREDPLCGPYLGRMKGIYRFFMFRTNLLAADARRAVEALAATGLELLLFKGINLALRYHGNLALRPMDDVDILVRPEDIPKAEAVLLAQGWRYRYADSKKPRDIHSHDYINANQRGFDMHWYTLYESPTEAIDQGVWERAEQAEWQGIPVRWMGREDTVLVAMVNGLREPEAMRFEWILDVAQVITARPGFDWATVWAEAGRRQLQRSVFDAMLLLNHLAPDLVPTAMLHAFMDSDDGLARSVLAPLISENRTHMLDLTQRPRLNAILLPKHAGQNWFSLWRARRPIYARLSEAPSAPKHIAFTTNAGGEIDSLYLHWQHLPLLATLFSLQYPSLAAELATRHVPPGEGWLAITPGTLGLPESDALPGYHARIQLADDTGDLTIPAGEAGEVKLSVINDSKHCWYVRPNSPALYGVSYHIHGLDGELLAWDQPRTYFLRARPNYLTFVAPGQSLSCRMKIHAPYKPGRYRLQLDVLQETILWFSGQGITFPSVDLEVIE